MKILLPVDGSAFTKRALDFIARHGTLFGPSHTYMALTVATQIPAHARRFLEHDVVEAYYREEAEKVLAPVREFVSRHSLSITTHHVIGHAAECIAAFAKAQQPDLIIMGSHGHSAIANLVLGSVAAGILARCGIPTLIVR
ncbi:universal stress protein [Paraburkholderia hospita]|uniref:universal stress protein n=1 Tax=Paraburkholderia hospita TaxID=169430 RepID=UPI000B3472F4|nr:universal stress protein [Paraburkholderia hospita]OUL96030.1 universal stress protein UspA [Paraburkholderia hospita]